MEEKRCYLQAHIKKTINFDQETHNEIQKLADKNERDFSGQVRFMIKEYLRIKKNS